MKAVKTFRISEAGQKRLASLCKEFDRSEGYVINKLIEGGTHPITRAVKAFK